MLEGVFPWPRTPRRRRTVAQVLVVADDLTGANATGARFARTGMRVTTVTPEHVSQVSGDYDVVVANLDSRHVPAEQASDLVTDVVRSEEHTSELQSRGHFVCRLLLEKKKK